MDTKTAELGYDFSRKELKQQCKIIYGGVSWPGERMGFAVVVGMDKSPHFDSHDIYLLDEYENWDMWKLVKQIIYLKFKYKTDKWVGDNKCQAADRLIKKRNAELSQNGRTQQLEPFSICPTPILMADSPTDRPYYSMLSEIRELLDEDQLELKDSKIKNYLGIKPEEVATLQFLSLIHISEPTRPY